MANYTVQDHINASLRKLGVLQEGEVPTVGQSNDALFALNAMVDQWQGDRGKIPSVVNTLWTLTPGQQTYTVGPGGQVNIPRPDIIDHVSYINNIFSPPIEFFLSPLTSDAWAAIPIKTLTSPYPTSWYYDYSFSATGLSNLNLWLVPTNSSLQGSIYVPTPFATFAGLQSTVLLPPGYWMMLDCKLAVLIAPEYGVQPSADIKEQAMEAESQVLRTNQHLMDMSLDAGALVQGHRGQYWFDIRVGP